MADGNARDVVTEVAKQVEDAHDKLGDLIEHGGVGDVGPTLDALSALAAAGPLLRLAVANGEVVDAVTSGRTAEAVAELHDAHTAELARALDVDTPVTWAELIEAAQARRVDPPTSILSTSSVLRALGDDPVIPYGWQVADVLDRIRKVRDQALEVRDAERDRINLFAAQLAGVLFGPSPEIAGVGDWGTPIGLDSLLTAARQLRADTPSVARVELANALGLFDVLPAWPGLLDRVRELVRLVREDVSYVAPVATGTFVDDGPVESLFGDRAPDNDHGPDR